MSIRLAIADDHELIRAGLRASFARTDIDVVGEASTAEQALQLGSNPAVDVIILDISWTHGENSIADRGFSLLSALRSPRPDLAILMYSVHDALSYVELCKRLGANGYLVKGVDDRLLHIAVRAVVAGEEVWPPSSRSRPFAARGAASHVST